MANKLVLLDTSVLIDYFRKGNKENTVLVAVVKQQYAYCISAVTDYEIYRGAFPAQVNFWNELLSAVRVLPFDKSVSRKAVEVYLKLKQKRMILENADLFIAATALAHGWPLVTLNKNHFEPIDFLSFVE